MNVPVGRKSWTNDRDDLYRRCKLSAREISVGDNYSSETWIALELYFTLLRIQYLSLLENVSDKN